MCFSHACQEQTRDMYITVLETGRVDGFFIQPNFYEISV
jgi:hypothetical protein